MLKVTPEELAEMQRLHDLARWAGLQAERYQLEGLLHQAHLQNFLLRMEHKYETDGKNAVIDPLTGEINIHAQVIKRGEGRSSSPDTGFIEQP